MTEILFKEESYKIVGACFEVYNELGSGFLEAVYQESLSLEFAIQGIPHVSQGQLNLKYKGQALSAKYVPDFVCFESILVELKALKETTSEHLAQVHNYLKATGLRLGLLVNFGQHPKLSYQRIVR
jgi:GxxExxY protein